jgi:uroporphyrinogen decarboxylase
MFLPHADLVEAITVFLEPIVALTAEQRRGWICGLGHGVLPGTPESAVRTFVRMVRERCA